MIPSRALRLPLAILALSMLPCLVPLHAAHAQLSAGAGHGDDQNADDADAKAAAAANAPPPALPGAVPGDPDQPSSHAAADMNPSAALFDAIDRGDLTAAKDALSRGADLGATNVLGQKPIDMSIDLNRNDITFLLLSMRNNDETGTGTQTEAASAQIGVGSGTGKVGHLTVRRHGARPGPVEQAAYAGSHAADQGGTAKPEVGFLGFGGT